MADGPTTQAPAPTPDASGQLDTQLQQLLSRVMQPRTSIPVPQQAPGPRQQMMTGPAQTHSEGAQLFFHNLGATIGNAVQQHKEKQIKDATGVLQTLHDAWESAQDMANGDQEKAKAIYAKLPQVQSTLGDPKKLKQLAKLSSWDAMNPEKANTVYHEAAKRVGQASRMKSAMDAVKNAIGVHQQQQQQQPMSEQTPQGQTPDQLVGKVLEHARPAPTDIKSAISLLGEQARASIAEKRATTAETGLAEKQREFDAKLAQDATKLKQQQDQFEERLKTVSKEKDAALAERKYEATLRSQTVKDVATLRTAAAKDMKAMPTGQSRSMGEAATAILQHIDPISKEIDDLNAKGKLGIVAGRYDDFMTGKIGANDPDFSRLRDDLSLLSSGTLRAHFGARGGAIMYDRFKAMFNQAGQSAENLKTGLDVVKDWMTVYQEMGKGTLPGEGTVPVGEGGAPATKKKDSLGIL